MLRHGVARCLSTCRLHNTHTRTVLYLDLYIVFTVLIPALVVHVYCT